MLFPLRYVFQREVLRGGRAYSKRARHQLANELEQSADEKKELQTKPQHIFY